MKTFSFLIIGWSRVHATGKGRTKRFCSESDHCGGCALGVKPFEDTEKGERKGLYRVALLNVKLRHQFPDHWSKRWQPVQPTDICIKPGKPKKTESDFKAVRRMTEFKYVFLKNGLFLEEKASECLEVKCLANAEPLSPQLRRKAFCDSEHLARLRVSLSQAWQDWRMMSPRAFSPREDKCFVISVSNWLSRTTTCIFATGPLDSAKYIYARWQRLDVNFLAKHVHRHLFYNI